MKKFLHTRVLPFLLCFTLTLGVVAHETPKAEAVVSETAILTGIACSFLASVGVSLVMDFATSGAMEQAVNGLLKAYAETDEAFQTMVELAASTGISAATGKLYIAKPLLEKLNGFVNWLISEKGVTAGGDAVDVANKLDGITFGGCYTSNNVNCFTVLGNMIKNNPDETTALIQLLGLGDKVLVLQMNNEVFVGFFFTADGVFCRGFFKNPYEAVNASFFGIYDLNALECYSVYSVCFSENSLSGSATYDWRIYYDKAHAEAWDDFLLSSCVVLNFSKSFYKSNAGNSCFYCYLKKSTDSVLGSSGSNVYAFYSNWGTAYRYSSGISYSTSDSDMYLGSGYSFNSSTLSVSVPDGVTVPDTESMTAPNTYYVTNVNVSNASGKDDFCEKLLALTLENNLTATGEVADAEEGEIDDTSTGTESGTVVDEESKGFLAYIPQIFEQIKSIPSAIAEKIGELFAPDEELIAEITDTFKAKFGFISTLKQLGDDLLSMTPETDPPVIWIHLEDAESEYGYSYGGMVKALDLTWYQKYKADVDRIVSGFLWLGFLWLGFLWLLFKRAASIIRGGEMLTEYSNDLTRTYRESASRENEAKFQDWLWRD